METDLENVKMCGVNDIWEDYCGWTAVKDLSLKNKTQTDCVG